MKMITRIALTIFVIVFVSSLFMPSRPGGLVFIYLVLCLLALTALITKKNKIRIFAVVLLVLSTGLAVHEFLTGENAGFTAALKYPGNGFSHFSKNKLMGDLNDDIQRQASSYPSIKFSQGKMIFKDISGFHFGSSKALIGPTYCLRVPVLIEKGSCRIEIDGVSYLVDQWGFRVVERGQLVYESKNDKPVDIIVEVFSPSNSSTRFHFVDKPVEIVQVGFSDPANISILLDDNCSGTLGPWEWLRGYE